MAMKQTQTKLFDFSDVGLDFCSGSKNLFPDRFKKMLALGYNEQTVSSVAVAGNQVTFTYGGTHGYVADRVLKVNAPELLNINGGEFVIDSVTENTVTMTIDGAPTSIAGNFTTKIASLGWELVYEQAHIHLYKFKHIDDTDMYARLCFQDTTGSGRNCIAVGVGRSFDLSTGVITDPNCLSDLANCATVAAATSNFKWDFTNQTTRSFDNYNYSQGLSTFGKGAVVGSKYHIALLFNTYSSAGYSGICGIFPIASLNYDVLDYPMVWGSISSTTGSIGTMLTIAAIYVGLTQIVNHVTTNANVYIDNASAQAASSYLPSNIDVFNTTTAELIPLYIKANGQFVGYAQGAYRMKCAATNAPSMLPAATPSDSMDIELNSKVKTHNIAGGGAANNAVFYAFPVEPVKYA